MISSMLLWLHSASIIISERMAYRLDYFISLIAMFSLEMIMPIFTYVIYLNSPGFAGWSFHQVLLLQGVFLAVKGISFVTFFGIVWNSNVVVMRGEFDFVLLKPRNTLFMFICNSFDAEDIAKFVGGIALMTYAIWHIPAVSFTGILAMITVIIVGLCFMLSIALFFSSFIFRYIRTWRVYELFELLELVGKYPKSIYSGFIGTFFTACLPIFVVAVFPTQALLGTLTKDILISTISVSTLLYISLKIWFATIKNYASAGG